MTKVFRLFGFCSTVLHHSLFIQFFFSFSFDVHLQSTAFSVHFALGCVGCSVILDGECVYKFRPHCEMHLISVLVDRASFGISAITNCLDVLDKIWYCSFFYVWLHFFICVCECVFFLWTRIHNKQTDWMSKQALKNQVTLIGMHFITDR